MTEFSYYTTRWRASCAKLWRALCSWFVVRTRDFNPYLLLMLPAFYLSTVHAVHGRYPISFSYAPNVIWTYEWAEQFRLGIWYPRWMEHTYAGLGSPTFNFYGPFAMYATLPFSVGLGLSVSQSVLYSFWAASVILGLGMAKLCDALFGRAHRWLSAVIAVMAMLSPYVLFNTYSRGALAETWAMALLPWLLAALLRSLDSSGLGSRYRLIGATSAFALCHPPSLMLGTCAIGLSLLVLVRNRADVLRAFSRGFLPMVVGFALVANYVVPAIGDQRYVNINFMTTFGGRPAAERLLATELGRLSFRFAEGYDGNIVPGFLFCCLAMVSVFFLVRRFGDLGGSARPRRMALLLACSALAALMMTDLAGGIYALLPLFNRVQFSWRWMVVLVVCALPLWGYVILLTARPRRCGGTLPRIPVWLATLWSVTNGFSTAMNAVDWNKMDADRTDALFARMARAGHEADASARPIRDFRGLLHVNAKDELILEDVPEYQPFTKSDGQLPPRTFDFVEWSKGEGTISDIHWAHGHRRFTIDSLTGGELLVRTSAWLGWQVTVNRDTVIGDESGDWGRMVVRLPQGRSQVQIDYRGTPNQRLGQWISLGVVAMLLAHAGLHQWRTRVTATQSPRTAQS